MKTNSTAWPRPEAWIAVSNSRQKIYGSKHVYLDNEQEFQIELFNPTSIKYLAKIYINGKLTSYSGLVLKPGQRYFLDRFVDEDKKLLFSTYEVESDNEEVQKAIEENGLIKVEFYAEDTTPNSCWSGLTWTTTTSPIYCYYTHTTPTIYGGSFSTTSSSSYLVSGSLSNASNVYATSTSTAGSFSTNSHLSYSETSKKTETGRIERGTQSDQSFGKDFGKYHWAVSYTSEYQILPRSVKPVEVSEIRSYCPGCRTRIKKKTWKFCPNCGESLD